MNGTLDGGWIYGCEEGGRRKDDLDCGHTIPHPHHTTPCPGGPIYRIVLYSGTDLKHRTNINR